MIEDRRISGDEVVTGIPGAALVEGIDVAAVQRFATLAELEGCVDAERPSYGQRRSATVVALERDLAVLETRGAIAATARVTSSGSMAQIVVTAALITPKRSRVVLVRPCYEGTERLFRSGVPPVELITVDAAPANPEAMLADVRSQINEHTAMVWVEAITNPSLQVPDIAGLSRMATAAGVPCVVDATLATPFISTPLLDGAAAVVHSLTKALNGHSDVFGGVAIIGDAFPEHARFVEMMELLGGGLSPHSAWLLRRSLSTAPLRLERAARNAHDLAHWLRSRPGNQVEYPHVGGTLISLRLDGGKAAVADFIDALQTIPLVPSFGHLSTTVSYPHLGHPDICARPGCGPGLLRISLGIESIESIIADISNAVMAANRPRHPCAVG